MYCKRCGMNLNEGTEVCPNCGEPTGNAGNGGVQPVMPPAEFTQGITMDGSFQKSNAGHKGLFIAGGIGSIVLIALILLLCNMTVVANFLRRTFSSPEDYYHYVEKKAVAEMTADAEELYGRYFLDNLDGSDKSVSAKMDVTIGEGGQDLLRLAGLAGMDMSWLESMSFDISSSVKKDAMAMGLGATVNGVNILTGNMIFDLENEVLYLQIPEVNERYLGVEMPDGSLNGTEEVWELYEALERVCPDQKELGQLINRYLLTAVMCMDDVSKSRKVLEAGGVEQKCTVLTVTVDENTFRDMLEEILLQMKEDKEIENIIRAAMAEEILTEELYLDDMSPEEAYEAFREWIDEELEFLDDVETYDDEMAEMKVYVDKKGRIVGRIIEAEDVTIHMLMPEEGKEFGCEFSYEDSYYEESVALTGTGRRSGDKIDGEFALAVDETRILDITVQELNTKDMKSGMLNGSMTFGLSEEAEELMDYSPGASMMQEMEVSMVFQSEQNTGSCNMDIFLRDQNLANVQMSYERVKGYQGTDPSQDAFMVEDMDDLMEWGEEFNLRGLTDALKEADVPSDITGSLEVFEDMDLESIFRMMYYYY